MGGSPILYKDTVIYLCDQNGKKSSLVAFDKKTGDIKWEAMRPEMIYDHTTPVLVDVKGRPELLIAANKVLQGVDPEDGKVIWSCAAAGDTASPVSANGLAYVDDGRGGPGICVDVSGEGDVTATHVKWKTPKPVGGALNSPILVGDLIYRLSGSHSLSCMRLDTGKVVYSEKLGNASDHTSPFDTPEGNIYFVSGDTSYVVKAGEKFELVASNELGDGVGGSAAVADGKIFVRGQGFIWCVGKK